MHSLSLVIARCLSPRGGALSNEMGLVVAERAGLVERAQEAELKMDPRLMEGAEQR